MSAMDQLIEGWKTQISDLQYQIKQFEEGKMVSGERRILLDGTAPWVETTQASIDRNKAWIADLQALLAHSRQ